MQSPCTFLFVSQSFLYSSLKAFLRPHDQFHKSRRSSGDRARRPALRCQSAIALLLLGILFLFTGSASASISASISGTVSDTSGAALVGASVRATNVETGITHTQQTNGQGYYSFQELPLGHYTIDVELKGFKSFRQTGLVLDVNAALTVDVTLQVGQVTEKMTVEASALHVETANTQMGEVIGGHEMTEVPLVTRSYTDLLALQPGVVSETSGISGAYAGQYQSAGFALPAVSGSESSGALSVNGMRETSNGFILNGATVQESGFGGTAVIPNLDSIAEFRILTNNFDAEYGNYSGGQINVVTKSGTNGWHGNAFEFLRNTNLDAANFFQSGQRGSYHQNQFGGTFGGPIKKDKVFFFADYQGNRVIQAVPQTIQGAPTQAEEGGDLSALAAADVFATQQVLPGVNSGQPVPVPTAVNGAAWAKSLVTATGNNNIAAGLPYYY